NSTALNPHAAAAPNRSRKGASLNIIERLAAKRGIPVWYASAGRLAGQGPIRFTSVGDAPTLYQVNILVPQGVRPGIQPVVCPPQDRARSQDPRAAISLPDSRYNAA